MTKYRHDLPQLGTELFLTDGGLETTLVFHEGIDLPCFAAFDLLRTDEGTETLRRYYRRHAEIARRAGVGFILESATWRSNPDWGAKLGYSPAALDEANQRAIDLMHEIRAACETERSPMVISGCIGPRGDGYDPGAAMDPEEAWAYHARQIRVLADAGADLVGAITMTNVSEAIGIALAARSENMPVAISFTLETDGRLPTGGTLKAAIEAVDRATGGHPAYYMINCAHPDHFAHVLSDEGWVSRLRGIRANASRCSHAELDAATELDAGDPVELGGQYRELRRRFPQITVVGGCCGTDHRHIEEISAACLEAA